MAQQKSRYPNARKVFLFLFIMSTLIAFSLVFSSFFTIPPAPPSTPTATLQSHPYTPTYPSSPSPGSTPTQVITNLPPPNPSKNLPLDSTMLATFGSCLTSIITFIGFVSTTVLTWRKEASERKDRDLERKLKEIELDKARFELEKLKEKQQKQSRKKTK